MFGRKSEWRNVPGMLIVPIEQEDGEIWADGNKTLPMLVPYITEDSQELLIKFRSSGYYMPMSMYGGPDNLGWPEEGDDERLLDTVSIDNGKPLPIEVAEAIFDLFENEVYGVEIEDVDL